MDEEMKHEILAAVRAQTEDLRAMNRRIISTLVRIEEKMDSFALASDLRDFRDDVNMKMDRFTGLLEDMRFRWAVQKDRTDEHDKRLKKLEAKRS